MALTGRAGETLLGEKLDGRQPPLPHQSILTQVKRMSRKAHDELRKRVRAQGRLGLPNDDLQVCLQQHVMSAPIRSQEYQRNHAQLFGRGDGFASMVRELMSLGIQADR